MPFKIPMLDKLRNKLVANPQLANSFLQKGTAEVPLAVHRTDFDFVRALTHSPHLKINTVEREQMFKNLSKYEMGTGAGQNGRTPLKRMTRQEIARLRKQFSVGSDFTASGRIVAQPPTPKEAASIWDRFMFRR